MDSCCWIVYLKKQSWTLAAKHLMITNVLTFCLWFKEDLVNWRLKRSKMCLIWMLSHWHTWFSKTLQVLFPCKHDVPHDVVLLSDMLFSLLWQLLCTQLVTCSKHLKHTFVNLLKYCLPQNWIDDIFVSLYNQDLRHERVNDSEWH